MTIRHRLTRRAVLGGGLAATLPLAQGVAQRGGPPAFGTVRHQFTLIRGARAVPFVVVPRIGGRSFSLPSFQGQVVLVNFWATWCPACRTELPELDRLQRAAGSAGPKVTAISVDRDATKVVAPFIRNLNLRDLTVGLDPGGLIARAGDGDLTDTPFALYAMPITYLIGPAGRVEGYIAGEADWLSADARRLLDYYANVGAG